MRMNSVTSESDLKSVEMAGLEDDLQSGGKHLNDSSFMSSDNGGVVVLSGAAVAERSSFGTSEHSGTIIEEEDQSPPNLQKAGAAAVTGMMTMTPIAEEEEHFGRGTVTTVDSSALDTPKEARNTMHDSSPMGTPMARTTD